MGHGILKWGMGYWICINCFSNIKTYIIVEILRMFFVGALKLEV